MNVELRDEAREDLVEGAVFYGRQSDGLDSYFLRRLREDIEKLRSTGGIHEQVTVHTFGIDLGDFGVVG